MKYFCRSCKQLTSHDRIHSTEQRGEDNDGFQWTETYFIIRCNGCDKPSFVMLYSDTEMILDSEDGEGFYSRSKEYPYFLAKGNELEHKYLLPYSIEKIYSETIEALKAGLLTLSATGFRIIIDTICRELGIEGEKLEDNIQELYTQRYLSLAECQRLHSIRFMGNSAVHAMEIPNIDQLYLVLEITNHLLNTLFIYDKIIPSKLDKLITEYDEYISLIKQSIQASMIGNSYKIDFILGRKNRLMLRAVRVKFREQLIADVKNGIYPFLGIVDAQSLLFSVLSLPTK